MKAEGLMQWGYNFVYNWCPCPVIAGLGKFLLYLSCKPALMTERMQQDLFLRLNKLQLSQSLSTGEVLQQSDHFFGLSLNPLKQIHVFLVLAGQKVDTTLQLGCHKNRGSKSPPSTCWSQLPWCSQGAALGGPLGCRHTLPAHFQLFNHWCSPSPSHRAALSPFITQSALRSEIALTQVQDLVLSLVELQQFFTWAHFSSL